MDAVFLKIVNMSITASYVIIAVLIARLILKKFPKKYSYLMWSVVGFRLCCPISFQSIFSLFSLKPFDMTKAQRNGGQSLDYITTQSTSKAADPALTVGIPSLNTVMYDNIPQTAYEYASKEDTVLFILSYIWLTVFIMILIYGIASYIKLKLQMSNAILLEKGIYQSDKADSPFILGILKPRIYIPFNLDNTVKDYVLTHEKYHIKRFDFIVKPAAFVILSIHWFNPLCWLAFSLMVKDMEMSCDEKVLNIHKGIKKEYSSALLSFAAGHNFPAASPLSFCESSVKGRIKNILSYKKPVAWLSMIAIMLSVGIIAGCAANPKALEINPAQIMKSQNSYTAGKTIASNGALSSIIDDGSYFADINTTKESLTITSIENEVIFESERTESKNFKIEDLMEYFDNLHAYIPDTIKTELTASYDEITQCIYYSDNSDDFGLYRIYWYKTEPLLFAEMWDSTMGIQHIFEMLPNTKNLDSEISNAVMNNCKDKILKGDYSSEAHYNYLITTGKPEDKSNRNYVTVYAQIKYIEMRLNNDILETVSEIESPAVMVFKVNENAQYSLEAYYDFNCAGKEIYNLLPEDVSENVNYFESDNMLEQICFKKVIEKNNININKAIESLFNTIESNPDADYSSSPSNYISASEKEYNLLLNYGDDTLKYIFNAFLKGGQTDLKGHLMRIVMDELIDDESIKLTANTGQEYFDAWYANTIRLYDLNDEEYMQEYCPKGWMLLEMDYIEN